MEGNIAFAQALSQQASKRLKDTIEAEEMDLSPEDLAFGQGVAAGLAATIMMHPTIRPDCSKITDMVKRPLSLVHIKPHETFAVLQKGQVRVVSYGFRAGVDGFVDTTLFYYSGHCSARRCQA